MSTWMTTCSVGLPLYSEKSFILHNKLKMFNLFGTALHYVSRLQSSIAPLFFVVPRLSLIKVRQGARWLPFVELVTNLGKIYTLAPVLGKPIPCWLVVTLASLYAKMVYIFVFPPNLCSDRVPHLIQLGREGGNG